MQFLTSAGSMGPDQSPGAPTSTAPPRLVDLERDSAAARADGEIFRKSAKGAVAAMASETTGTAVAR